MAPRPRPTDDRVQAGATLGQGEVGRAGGVAIREQQPNLLGEDRIPSPGEPGGPVGAGGLGAELLRMATAEEQRLPAQPEATEQAQIGRASCRERGSEYVEISGVAVTL